jgi:SagB-type dehydrogenase family enzyme
LPHPQLYCIVQRVQDIEAGVYKYQASTHTLIPIRTGHFSKDLQTALYGRNVNIELGAYTLHIADTLDFRESIWGNRAYRIQQMLVGAALDTVMLVSSDRKASSHALLGFNAELIDRLYALDDSPCGVLAQICVGTARRGLYREGSLIS